MSTTLPSFLQTVNTLCSTRTFIRQMLSMPKPRLLLTEFMLKTILSFYGVNMCLSTFSHILGSLTNQCIQSLPWRLTANLSLEVITRLRHRLLFLLLATPISLRMLKVHTSTWFESTQGSSLFCTSSSHASFQP